MTIVIHASGGVSHSKEVPREKQQQLAEKIASLVKAAMEENCASGSGTVTVGMCSATFSAQSTLSADA